MATTGLLFPGQGAQYVGMGKDLYDQAESARRLYDRAETVLSLPLKAVSFSGPEEELRKTFLTQPAILVHSLVCYELLRAQGLEPRAAAGHSLGEYSALYAAQALDLESVLVLVRERGRLMFEEGTRNPGTMAAIIGLADETVEEICRTTTGTVILANYNAPKQVVISGEPAAVAAAGAQATQAGALKVVPLAVSGAFHSPLLDQSAQAFRALLDQTEIRDPKFPVIANRTGRASTTAAEVRAALNEQLNHPVLWTTCMQAAQALGCSDYIEVGPGKVLTGLLKRILPDAPCRTAGTAAELIR